jgi:signal transduction histidine kinase
LEARDIEALRQTLDRLRLEVEELRASRKRLVQAADTERRTIERDLHEGVQQHLVGLAVNLQLASQLVDTDLAAANALLGEMGRDVQQALAETAQLAQQIYPPLLEAGSLASALRAAATSTGIRASVKVEAASDCPPEVVRTVYLCCLGALEHAGADAPATITVREADGALAFDVVAAGAGSDAEFDQLCDRVEALGGRLTIRTEPRGVTRISGSLPLSQ